ncbi:efflux RND transporter periplasmic adaptor subunit, partial [bacterium]|nr:efflux RND transporter periplasmic adaptor subunit [bacterium]
MRLRFIITLLGICYIFNVSCGGGSGSSIENYTVKRAEFVISVTETGECDAVNSNMIFAPPISWQIVSSLKIVNIVEDGEQVEKGDVIIEFDKAEVEKMLITTKSELEIAEAELRKKRADHRSKLEGLVSDLEIAKIGLDINRLELKLKAYESEIERKDTELDLEKAAILLEKAEQEIENQKKIQQKEIDIQELKVQQVKDKLKEAERTLDMLTVKAPGPGIAIIRKSWRTGNKWAVEDQTWPGQPMIGLPDLSLMQVDVPINEIDVSKIDISQKTKIKLEAYPDTFFYGHITEIATLARIKERDSKVKVFDVKVLIDENDEKLMSGMTVSCEIIVDKIPDVLFIPLEA